MSPNLIRYLENQIEEEPPQSGFSDRGHPPFKESLIESDREKQTPFYQFFVFNTSQFWILCPFYFLVYRIIWVLVLWNQSGVGSFFFKISVFFFFSWSWNGGPSKGCIYQDVIFFFFCGDLQSLWFRYLIFWLICLDLWVILIAILEDWCVMFLLE